MDHAMPGFDRTWLRVYILSCLFGFRPPLWTLTMILGFSSRNFHITSCNQINYYNNKMSFNIIMSNVCYLICVFKARVCLSYRISSQFINAAFRHLGNGIFSFVLFLSLIKWSPMEHHPISNNITSYWLMELYKNKTNQVEWSVHYQYINNNSVIHE